jgi:membrane protein
MKYWNDAKAVIKLAYRDIERKHLPLVAAGLAFYFQMSLFPALVLLAAVMAYMPQENGVHGATSLLAHVIPRQGVSILESALTTISPYRTGLLSFGLVTALWLASIGSKGLIAGLDIVYNVHRPRPLWINRILAVGLTFAVGVLLLLAVGLTLIGPVIETLLSKTVPVQSLWLKMWPYVQWFLAATFTFAAIELLYLLAPNVPAARRLTIPGALVAAGACMVLSWGLGFYFHHFGTQKFDKFYGIPTTLVVLIVWLYWCARAILIGAQINVSLQEHKALKLLPRGLDAA